MNSKVDFLCHSNIFSQESSLLACHILKLFKTGVHQRHVKAIINLMKF